MKQRPLQTQVTKWSLFFSYFNFNEQGGPQGRAGPSPRTLEGLLPGATRPETLAVLLPARVRRRVPLVWALGCGKRRACASGRGARRCRWREKYTLFIFRFCQRQTENGMGLRACSAVAAQVLRGPAQLPRPFTPSPGGRLPLPGSERWPGGPGEGSTSLPPLPFQNLIQCFLVWGPGPKESTHLAAAVVCPTQYPPYTTRAFSGPLSPRQWSLSDKRACTCGCTNPSCLQLFFVLPSGSS